MLNKAKTESILKKNIFMIYSKMKLKCWNKVKKSVVSIMHRFL